MQLGCGAKRDKQLNGWQRGHFAAAGVDNKRKVAEFRVTPDALLPVGTEIRACHFAAGQYVDVTGTTIGKGFQVLIQGVVFDSILAGCSMQLVPYALSCEHRNSRVIKFTALHCMA